MKRLIAIAVGVAAFAIPGVAAAHTPNVADNCQGLNVTLTNYEGGSSNNQVVVTIDGGTQAFTFGNSFTKSFTWSTSSAHVWTVVIDANRLNGNPTQYDKTFNGTEQPCTTTTTSSTTTTTTPEPTTTTAATTTTSGPATTSSPSTTTPETSSTVEVGEPPIPSSIPPTPTAPPTPAPASPANPILPVTGDHSGRLGWIAFATVGFGAFLWLTCRRPT